MSIKEKLELKLKEYYIREKLEAKLEEYYKRFNEHFPCEGIDGDDVIIEIIDECLKKGEPYDPYEGLPPGAFI